ncbi:MAG: S8 family serine peptidase, partial [Nocardioidaceae bacterium]
MRRSFAALIGVCALVAAAAVLPVFASGSTSAVSASSGVYLVVLRPEPLATYDGSIPGYAATAPRPGHRFRADRPTVTAYEQYLLAGQDRVRTELGDPPVLYTYTTAVNGFSAELNGTQVKQLRAMADVLTVEASRTEHLAGTPSDTVSRAVADGVWRTPVRADQAGRGVVVGVVDSGLWPDNPSFAGVPLDASHLHKTYPGFTGTCETGEQWSAATCNAKVIAARSFLAGFGAANLSGAEYPSPRDGNGHGSHTAAIAAGNTGVDVSIGHQDFGHVSGVAPAAAIAVYKACWAAPDPDNDGCTTPDTVKAVDQAVRDGVDVLNYSITGHGTSPADVVELAFLNASSAGVFVAASAGDNGPRSASVSHQSPWVTTVGASRFNTFQGAVVLGNGRRYVGAMVSNKSVRDAPLIYAGDVPSSSANHLEASLCYPGSLDAGAVDGAIVVCDRGNNARVAKSLAVDQAGGAAMVLVNEAPGTTEADLHTVPSVHVGESGGDAIKTYIAKAHAPTASLNAQGADRRPPTVADFSSRGPATVTGGDVLKPDVTAPGVSILAAVAPPSNFGHLWDISSGTSMASPQVAGLAAVIRSVHPGWTPAMTKSALMTSARPMAGDEPLDQGAGEVTAGSVLDPGLVYGAGRDDWLTYLRA